MRQFYGPFTINANIVSFVGTLYRGDPVNDFKIFHDFLIFWLILEPSAGRGPAVPAWVPDEGLFSIF